MKKYVSLLFASFYLFCPAGAQSTADPFSEMLRRMDQMMQRGVPQPDSTGRGSLFFSIPMDSMGTFRFDTTFQDGSGSFFFHFSPGQMNGETLRDPFGMDLMQDFFSKSFEQLFQMPNPGQPADDGALRQEGDLLPEERLRQSENAPPPAKKPAPAAPKKPDSDIKTIRI